MSDRVVDTDKGYKRIRENIAKLAKASIGDGPGVFVGVRADKDGDLLTIAAVNEFGSSDGHVPERSYLRSTIDKNRQDYITQIVKILDAAYTGRTGSLSTLHRGLSRLGAKAAGDVQKTMTALSSPANAPSTVERKGADNPLIDTGRLRQSIDFEVRGVGGG
tara:strand:+ start:4136 stop:4621 length:486 start_codon:yes stop_codon:yes gene_type:complete